jgi:hypothetical protein
VPPLPTTVPALPTTLAATPTTATAPAASPGTLLAVLGAAATAAP